MTELSVKIVRANLEQAEHADAILSLLSHYAQHPMGGGHSLPPSVIERIIPGLRAHEGSLVFLAYREERAIGVAVCMRGFSTFRGAPLLNIHDLAVHEDVRGRGVGKQLLTAVEEEARATGCCRVTLEVREDNTVARALYEKVGFDGGEPGGSAMSFFIKPLA